jgi:hypothetical protein
MPVALRKSTDTRLTNGTLLATSACSMFANAAGATSRIILPKLEAGAPATAPL